MKNLFRILYLFSQKPIPIIINPFELEWKYIKGSGPGG
jgi:hypothetical protein